MSSRHLVCKRSTSAPASMTSCASSSMSAMLAVSSASPRVEHALGRSHKRLLPYVLDRGDVKLCVRGGGVCHERHCRHLLLDGHLICCKLVDCRRYFRWDCCGPLLGVAEFASCPECNCLRHSGCIVGRVGVLTVFLICQHVEHIVTSLGISLLSSCRTKGQGLEVSGVCLMDESLEARIGLCYRLLLGIKFF
jgi:hypothetical protein